MFCWSQTSCDLRYQDHPYWMSSTVWGNEFAQGGIFSNVSSQSSFYNANRVFVKYCRRGPRAHNSLPERASPPSPFASVRPILSSINVLQPHSIAL